MAPGMCGALALLRELDNFRGHLPLGLAGDLKLNLHRPQNFPRLRGDGVGSVRQDVIVLQVGQRLPKDIFEAASCERPDYGFDSSGCAGGYALARL